MQHETAHYYFYFGPRWFSEGGAEYVAIHFNDASQDIPRVENSDCRDLGFNSLHDLEERGHVLDLCLYSMGLHFLVKLREAMGDSAWLSALRALYAKYGFASLHMELEHKLGSEEIYRVFMEHTPTQLRNKVRDVFRRLHGGQFVN